MPWAQLNNQRVTLSFKPATADDEAALLALLPDGDITDISQLPTSIPSYLVNVIPELKLNGEVIKSGDPMALGAELGFGFDTRFAGGNTILKSYNVIAGSFLSIAVIAGNISPTKLNEVQNRLTDTKTKLESADPTLIGTLTREEILGDMFYAGTLGYYAQYIALSHLAGLQQKTHHYLAAGLGSMGYEPTVSYFFGFPRNIELGGVVLNIPMIGVSGTDTADAEAKKNFLLQIGAMSSALEHAVPEQMFTDPNDTVNPPPDAISAVKALSKAQAAGQRIYHITSANQNTVLPNINHDSLTMGEIQAALAVGKEVITHTDAVSREKGVREKGVRIKDYPVCSPACRTP